MMAILASLGGLALVDALNPFSIAALIYLLATPRPLVNGSVFIAGTYVAYLVGGLLVLAGWQALISVVAPILPWWATGAFEMLAGTALLGLTLWMKLGLGKTASFSPPVDLKAWAILLFAVGSTVADLTSAVPYFAAINLLSLDGSVSAVWQVMGLVLYCFIYCLPLLVLLVCRAAMGSAAECVFARIRNGTDWLIARTLAPLMALCGLLLLIDGLRRLLMG